jgi:DNA-binding beta-propeller fold protein YncE
VGAIADDPRGGVAIADTANDRVQTYGADGSLAAAWGIPGRGPGYVTRPRGVALAPDGGVTVADTFDHRVERFGPDGAYAGQYGLISSSTGYATAGDAAGQFDLPRGVAYDPSGNLWVADSGNDRLVELAPDGSVRDTVGGLSDPEAVAAGACGVVVADTGDGEVWQNTTPIRTGLAHPRAVACDGTTVYAADDTHVYDLTHNVQVPGTWDHPTGLAAGGGVLYVAQDDRVLRVAGGTTTTLAGSGTGVGEVDDAAGLALSADGRTLLVADAGNDRVLRFDAPGVSVPHPPQLSVGVDSITRGRVVSSPPGIECATDCSQHFGPGTVVTLTATPVAGSVFTGWTGACAGQGATCAVRIGGDGATAASFVAAPPPPPPAPPVQTSPPPKPKPAAVALSRLKLSTRTLKTSATVSLRLTRAATLTVTVQAARDGRRSGSRCVAPRSGLHKGCTRYVNVHGSRRVSAHAGTTRFTLSRRFAGRTLKAGRYRLAITALDTSGNRVGPVTITFTVRR